MTDEIDALSPAEEILASCIIVVAVILVISVILGAIYFCVKPKKEFPPRSAKVYQTVPAVRFEDTLCYQCHFGGR